MVTIKRFLVLVLCVFCFVAAYNLTAQTYFYYNYDNKVFFDKKISNKYYIVVDSTINDANQLAIALNDSSIYINRFYQSNVLSTINVYDSTSNEKHWAIIGSKDSIDFNLLSNNPHINYIGKFFEYQDHAIGISRLFYVQLKNVQDISKLDSLSNKYSVNILGNNDYLPLVYAIECTQNSQGNALYMANLFYETGIFEYAVPNFLNSIKPTLSCVDDQMFNSQWGLQNTGQWDENHQGIDIKACQAWQITKGNSDIIIAVLDSGIKLEHPDLPNVPSAISWDLETGSSPSNLFLDYENLGNYNHGTNCAGIIGAAHNEIGVAGIAPQCILMSLSLDFGNQDAIELRFASGIMHAWQNGADVINNSWVSSEHPVITSAINEAVTYGRNNLGCIFVASSGNGNSPNISFPSSHSDVIAVGAVDACGIRVTSKMSDWEYHEMCGSPWNEGSNYGQGLSVVAPGTNIPTTNILPSNYIYGFNGTSSAAPHVAGVAALLLSVNPNLTYQQIKDIIESSAQKIRDDLPYYEYQSGYPNGTWNEKLGYGLVDAYAALLMLCTENDHILQYEQIAFEDFTVICEDIIVDGTLTIDADVLFYSEEPQIIVNSGGTLIIANECNLLKTNNEIFNGNIIVNPGGTLEISNGGTLTIAG